MMEFVLVKFTVRSVQITTHLLSRDGRFLLKYVRKASYFKKNILREKIYGGSAFS